MTATAARLDAITARASRIAVFEMTAAERDRAYLLTLARKQAAALEAVAPLIRYLIDSSDCWFDHHGGCQAHGYISLEPGETCPQHDAKEWIKALGAGDE